MCNLLWTLSSHFWLFPGAEAERLEELMQNTTGSCEDSDEERNVPFDGLDGSNDEMLHSRPRSPSSQDSAADVQVKRIRQE